LHRPRQASKQAAAPVVPDSFAAAITVATIKCIRRLGVAKVFVEDIAKESGISRRTIYRLYPNRRAIMRAVVLDRAKRMGRSVRGVLERAATFEDAVIEGSLETLRVARADKVFVALAASDHTLTLDFDAQGSQPPLQPLFEGTWHGVFERARLAGKLRADLTSDEAEQWLRSMHYLLSLREDLDDLGKEVILRKFVVPSLVASPAVINDRSAETQIDAVRPD
jgi:AcrR family transcriptional regulator